VVELRDWNSLRKSWKGGISTCGAGEEASDMALGAGEIGRGDGAGVGGRMTGMRTVGDSDWEGYSDDVSDLYEERSPRLASSNEEDDITEMSCLGHVIRSGNTE
jgi:hypothetical protein